MVKDDTVYLQHVLDAINTIQEYLLGVNEDQFQATRLLQDGVIRQIEIVGEAVRRIFQKTFAKSTRKFPGRILRACGIN